MNSLIRSYDGIRQSILPVALVANATRIVITSLLFQHTEGEWAHKFSHDAAGWVMIPYAAGLFALVLFYLNWLVREEQQVSMANVMRNRGERVPS